MSEKDDQLFNQFIDDYFADCDEHLSEARRGLIDLESALAERRDCHRVIENLFRNFHTVKGLSGMFGLVSAEALAHQMESVLAALRKNRLELTQPLIHVVEAGVQRLEAVLAARRANAELPAIDDVLRPLDIALIGAHAEAAQPVARDASVDASVALLAGHPRRWEFMYQPSAETAASGLSVDLVRANLARFGQVQTARPRIAGDGVAFEFIVASDTSPDQVAELVELAAAGLQWRPLDDGGPLAAALAPAAANAQAVAVAALVEALVEDTPPAPQTPAGEPVREVSNDIPVAVARSNIVRIDLSRLDDLMHLLGEVVTSRARLAEQLASLQTRVSGGMLRPLQETSSMLERQLRSLREGIMHARLVPIGETFERMRFVVRDLVRDTGKPIRLDIVGERTEIDKLVVERLMDPLLHIVRNAISHGIESVEERTAAGKPAEALLRLSAATAGDVVQIDIEDDGRGIDREQVAATARAQGLLAPGQELDAATLLDILCTPGFSTRSETDRLSGRGVGMDVARSTVYELGGQISVASEPGRGTRFTLQLPMTLLITDALLVSVGTHLLAIPQPSLREVFHAEAAEVRALEANEMLPYRDGILPLLRLASLFGWPAKAAAHLHVLVVGHGAAAVGLVVDRIEGQREIVVRTFADPLVRTPGIAGATQLADGRVILILDAGALAQLARTGKKTVSRRAAPASIH